MQCMNPPIFESFVFLSIFTLWVQMSCLFPIRFFFICTWLLVSNVTLDIPKQVLVFEINAMLKYYIFVKCILAGRKLFI